MLSYKKGREEKANLSNSYIPTKTQCGRLFLNSYYSLSFQEICLERLSKHNLKFSLHKALRTFSLSSTFQNWLIPNFRIPCLSHLWHLFYAILYVLSGWHACPFGHLWLYVPWGHSLWLIHKLRISSPVPFPSFFIF